MANELDKRGGVEGGPQPTQGRELVIVGLGHLTIMAEASGRRHGRRGAGQHLHLSALRPRVRPMLPGS
jgi:hypothetical protein